MTDDTCDDFDERADLATADETIRRLKARIDAALTLHAPVDTASGKVCGACRFVTRIWPCPTVRVLKGEEEK